MSDFKRIPATATLPGRLDKMRAAVDEVLEVANFCNGDFVADRVSSTADYTLILGTFEHTK